VSEFQRAGWALISKEQLSKYKEDGFVVVKSVVDELMLRRINNVVDNLIAQSADIKEHNEIYDLEPNHTPEQPRVRRIKTPHKWDSIFWDLVNSERMTECLRTLLGPNVRLHGSKLNMKLPGDGAAVEWHQDWAFYPHTNDDVLAVGVMLDDITDDNGPMLAISGSHNQPKVWDHHQDGFFCGAINPENASDVNFDSAVRCTGQAGDCSFHHVRLIHGSESNTSLKPRRLLLYECSAADAWPLLRFSSLEEFDSRMICGEPTIEPRSEDVPIRMPLPPAVRQGSIYENQIELRNRYFT